MWLGTLDGSNEARDCSNSGLIIGMSEGERVGGVFGNANIDTTITSCNNSGTIEGKGKNVGGVVGAFLGINTIMTSCYNSGSIVGNGNCVGGVAGAAQGNIEKCINSGTIEGNGNYVGGVAGTLGGTAEKCINTGEVKHSTAGEGLGGIIGETITNCEVKILNCYNTGKLVEKASNVTGAGGIIGYISTTGASGEISHNYNIGEIEVTGTNVTNVGGAVGRYATTTFTIENNYYELNKSNVTLNDIGTGLEQSGMTTQQLVDLLNASQTDTPWQLDTGINNGYPILKWQVQQ